jgi:hypothetical protein
LDTGYPASTVVPDVPEVGTFRTFILDAINELPQDGFRAEGMMHNAEGSWYGRPWETREGGRDER